MATADKEPRRTDGGNVKQTSGRSRRRFALVIGVGAAVAAMAIVLAVTYVVGPEGELAFDALVPAGIIVQPLGPSAGSPALVRGSGFSPGDEITFYFNEEEMRSETTPEIVTADNFGEFNAEIILPSELERVDNIVTAIDESGNSAQTVIRLPGPENRTMPFTGIPRVS